MKLKISLVLLTLLAVSSFCQETEDIYTQEEPMQITDREAVGQPEQPVETKATTVDQTNQQTVVPPPPHIQQPMVPLTQKYLYEIVFVSLIIIFLLNYKTGKRKNELIVDRWVRSVMPLLRQNFALIGFEGPSEQNENRAVILEESAHEFTVYATGRDNLSFLEATFELKKREDMLSHYMIELVFPQKDLVTLDMPTDCTTPLVFCLAKKKEVKTLKEKCPDLNHLTKNFDVKGLHENYRILGESADTIDHIFDGYTIKQLGSLINVIHSIHYTDQKIFTRSPGHLKLVLNASPLEAQKNELTVRLALYMVDRINSLKLSSNLRTTAERAREAFAATKEKQELEKRQEELQKQKAEKRKQEEERIRKLPPEKQKKYIEKERMKETRRQYGKIMKVM